MGDEVLQLPTDTFDSGDGRGTIIDSGTTLAYLPDLVYEALMTKVNPDFLCEFLHFNFIFFLI